MINFIIVISPTPLISKLSSKLADYNADNFPLEILYSRNGIEVALSNPGIKKEFILHETDAHIVVLSGYIRRKGSNDIILPKELVDFAINPRAHVFAGMFCLCVVDKIKRVVYSWNTLSRQIPLYYSSIKNSQGIVVGTRSSLLSVIYENSRPSVNTQNLYPFYSQGFHVLEDTPFLGIKVAPANSFIRYSEHEVLVSACSNILDNFSTKKPSDELYDNLADILANSVAVRPYLDDSATIDIGITGGRDSRLLFAALKKSGNDFSSYTIGNGGHPDVVLGKMIAERTNIEHRVIRKDVSSDFKMMSVNPVKQALTTLFHTDWAASGYDRLGSFETNFSSRYGVNGAFGGLIRGGYPNLRSLESPKNIALLKLDKLLSDFDLLTDEASNLAHLRTAMLKKHLSTLGSTDGLDQLHLLTRAGRWASATFMATRSIIKLTPFADNEFLHEMYQLDGKYRVTGILLFELLRRFEPSLAYLPFLGKTYPFVDNPPVGYQAIADRVERPIESIDNSSAYFNWRFAMDSDLGTLLKEQINNALKLELGQLLDQKKVYDLMCTAERNPHDRNIGRLMWGLYSSSLTCSCHSRSESNDIILNSKSINIPVVDTRLV